MKSSQLPPIRVEPALRIGIEQVLQQGETLSSFVEGAVREEVSRRQDQEAFLRRGMESLARYKATGEYVTLEELDRIASAFVSEFVTRSSS